MNIAEIEAALRELVDQPFDPAGFVFDFLRIYDAPKSTVTKLRQSQDADLLQSGDVLWKKKLWFRVAPKGKAARTVDAMVADPVAAKQALRFFLATDGHVHRNTHHGLNFNTYQSEGTRYGSSKNG